MFSHLTFLNEETRSPGGGLLKAEATVVGNLGDGV